MGRMAAFVQMMPFALLHFGKPPEEMLGSVIAGVALGLLALRTRSFWYGALVHAAVALSMDLLVTFAHR
jgi:membrane protease YdiL (CAAX protease family)